MIKAQAGSAGWILICIAVLAGQAEAGDVPDFSTRNLRGEPVRLSELLKKGPVVLDFWATHCKPCLKAMPELEKLYQEHRKQGLTVLGINEDGPRGQAKVKPFLRRVGVTYPVILDKDGSLMRLVGATACPSVVVVSRDGNAVLHQTGYGPGDAENLAKAVNSLFLPKASGKPD